MIEKGQFEEARRFLTNTREKAEVATIAAKLSPASLKLLPCLASRTNPGNADSAKTRLELRGFGLTKQDRRWRHDLVLTERGRAVLAALLAKGER
jgi:hypothetical protein